MKGRRLVSRGVVEVETTAVMNIFNHTHYILKTRWHGTVILGLFIFQTATFSPLIHAIVGWVGAWWCYSTLNEGHGGKARWVVGFLCWTASFRAVNHVLVDATIYCLHLGWIT